jgi:hypothetical protein
MRIARVFPRRTSATPGDVLGMAGPGKKIAGLMCATVIRPGDMADNILDREKHPEWQGERTKLVYAFPSNEKLWVRYAELRADSLRNDGDGQEATEFYRANREAMDAGAVADAAEGTTGKMDDLGLSARDFAGKGVYQQFATLATAISKIPDATARSAAAMNIFGRSGTMIVPMLERLNELTGEAKQFGFIRSTASAKQAKEFADALMMLTKAAKGLWYSLGSAVAPILKDLADRLRDGAIWLRDFAKEHPGLIRLAFRLGAGLALAGAMVAALGSALQLTSAALGSYATIQAIAAAQQAAQTF